MSFRSSSMRGDPCLPGALPYTRPRAPSSAASAGPPRRGAFGYLVTARWFQYTAREGAPVDRRADGQGRSGAQPT
ncbi:protein of unassigned function [Methylobacterium oryzae CBMB20]|uniref:Protein of unassigned function n=1 Tax=Methylobacterium oryzae CBMB20 TaxID=693986 RepID=A0A089NTI5_9HYPH|nr:protein of unassigned function [Methylobacterium oryzae CBMB20]